MLLLKDRKKSLIEKKKVLIDRLLQNLSRTYLLGRNRYTDILIERFTYMNHTVSGIIDDFTNETNYKGLQIYRMSEINPDSIVISCVIDGRMVTAIDRLFGRGFQSILTYCDLHLYDPSMFPVIQFCESNIADIERNMDKYEWLYNRLDDQLSKETLINILDFRYNFDLDTMRKFSFRLDKQYFDIIPLRPNEIFVDCGGFDGATSLHYIHLNPQYEQVHIFEPSPEHVQRIRESMSKYPRVFVHPYATYNKHTTLRFDASHGSASRLDRHGDVEVQTVCLDDVIPEATFIKLDVEGAEYESLLGAERIITTYRPRIAVCVYHVQEHFWRIPELICSYWSGYRVLLRHYTEGIMETVMYFV